MSPGPPTALTAPTGDASPSTAHRRTGWTAPDAVRRAVPGVVITFLAALSTAVVVGRPMLLLGVAAALAGLLLAQRPSGATLIAVGLLFSNAVVVATTEHGVPGVVATVIPLLLAVAIAHRTIVEGQPVVVPIATPWVVGLMLVQLAGALLSHHPGDALADVGVFASEGLLVFVLVGVAAQGAEVVRRATLIIVGLAAVLSLLSLAQSLTGFGGADGMGFARTSDAVIARDEVTGEGHVRRAGPIGEQNRWAQTLAVTVPLALALAATDRTLLGRLTGVAALPAILAGIVLTYSRGAAVGLVLVGVVAAALRWLPRRAAAAGALLVALGLAVLAPTYVSRAATVVDAPGATGDTSRPVIGEETSRDGSFSNRAVEASAAFAVFVHHPWVGVGTGQFPGYFQDEARRLGADRIVGVDREAHNLYLGLAAETGVLGLVAFAGVVVCLLRPLAAVRRHAPAHVAGMATGWSAALVVYLMTGLFLHFAYIRYFWLFAGIAAAAGLSHRTTSPTSPGSTATERTAP